MYSAAFFNKFVIEIFGNLLFGRLQMIRYFFKNKPKKFPKMHLFQYKIGLINLPSIGKVMENQVFSCI